MGQAYNYDLCINSASYGIDEAVNLILKLLTGINKYPLNVTTRISNVFFNNAQTFNGKSVHFLP
ncbi:MAG: hypothetical protein ACLT33_07620 [Lachnospira pectinoschiza]